MKKIILLNAWRDLRASLAQTIALVVIVALGVASLTTLIGAYRDLGTSYNRTYDELGFADATFSLQGAPAEAEEAVRKIEGVSAATGRLVVDTGLELPAANGAASKQMRLRLVGIPASSHPQVNDVMVLDGSYLDPGKPQSLLIESHFADFYNYGPGDTVTPIIGGKPMSFSVAGVVASPEYLVITSGRDEVMPSPRTFAVMFLSIDELRRLTGAEGINDIAVRFDPGADAASVTRQVEQQLQPYGLRETILKSDQASYAALKLDLDGYRQIAYLMPGIILLVAAFSLYILLSRQVLSHRPQIGLMKALGYGDGAIIGRYLLQAALVGLIGSLIGLLVGFPLTRLVTEAYASELGIPLVETRFYFDLVLAGVALSLLVALLAGIGPARSSARLRPAEAMRQDPSAAAGGRVSPLERLLRVPFWLRLPLRNIGRARRRAVSTGLGVVFSLVLVLMAWGMFESMNYMFSNNFNDVERWDISVAFSEPQPQAALEKVVGQQGVSQVEPILQLPAALDHDGGREDLVLTGLPPGQDLHHLQLSDSTGPGETLAGNGLVLSSHTAGKLGIGIGDPVTLKTYAGELDLTLKATMNELLPSVAYVSLETASAAVGAPGSFNGALLTVGNSADQDRTSAGLYLLPEVASVQLKDDIESDWQSLLGFFYVFIGVIMAFALAMAFALLFNTMTVNVLERRREFATMRSVGAGRGRIAMLVSVESFLLWLIALAPGMVLGWLATRQLVAAFDSDLFTFRTVVTFRGFLITSLGILLTMLLAALPAIRRVNRLNLGEATKILN